MDIFTHGGFVCDRMTVAASFTCILKDLKVEKYIIKAQR